MQLRDLPTELPDGAGVAVFMADTGGLVDWLPLPATALAQGMASFTIEVLADPPLRVTVAPSERAAHVGYWIEELVPGPRDGATSRVRS